MSRFQNCLREAEALGPQDLRTRYIRRAVRVTVSNASIANLPSLAAVYSTSRRTFAVDSLQIQPGGDRGCNLWLEEAVAGSALGRGPRGLPVDGGDERLEADAADDLFEGAVVAVRRDEQ